MTNCPLTVAGGGDFDIQNATVSASSSPASPGSSPLEVDCNGSLSIDDSQFTVDSTFDSHLRNRRKQH